MDIDEATEKVGKAEKLIQAIWGVLIRNWGKLIVIAALATLAWFCTLAVEEAEGYDEEPYEEYQEDIEEWQSPKVYRIS